MRILSFFLLVISCHIEAQGTLQFNQIIRIKNTTATANFIDSITVPAGKVWKIEASSIQDGYGELLLDGQVVYKSTVENFGSGGDFTINTIEMPVWLPAGTYALNIGDLNSPFTGTVMSVISGIEFNVLQ